MIQHGREDETAAAASHKLDRKEVGGAGGGALLPAQGSSQVRSILGQSQVPRSL